MTEKPLLAALRGNHQGRPPIWLMRQAGRYLPEYRALRASGGSFLDFCYQPDLAVEAALQPLRRFKLDAAIVFSDILVVPDALGQRVEFRQGTGPALEPVRSAAAVAGLKLERLSDHLQPVYQAVRRTAAAIPAGTTMIGFAGAPWTVAAYMVEGQGSRDFATAKRLAFTEPETFGALIDLLTEATIRHLQAQIDAGAEVVQIFDTWAGLLPETLFRAYCLAPLNTIAGRLQAARPDVPLIVFPRGAGLYLAAIAAIEGVAGVSIDSHIPLDWAGSVLQAQTTVQGNLDSALLVAGGQAMTDDVRRILAALGDGPFIFNLGHGIVPETPPDHVAELVAAVADGR